VLLCIHPAVDEAPLRHWGSPMRDLKQLVDRVSPGAAVHWGVEEVGPLSAHRTDVPTVPVCHDGAPLDVAATLSDPVSKPFDSLVSLGRNGGSQRLEHPSSRLCATASGG
jgi:hypothetical protein